LIRGNVAVTAARDGPLFHRHGDTSRWRCIPTLAAKPPQGPGWVHEIKHDGYRLIVRRDGEAPAAATTGQSAIRPSLRLRLN
jgi:hypothetical protein